MKASVLLSLVLLPTSGFAAFSLIENFDSLAPAALNGQAGWTAGTTWNVAAAPAGGSGQAARSASANGTNHAAYRALPAPIPAVSTSSTYFFRMMRTGGGVNISAGLSDEAVPALFGGFETQVNSQGGDILNVRDAGAFDPLGAGTFAIDTWYNVWMVVNNSTDTYQVWLDAGAYGSAPTAVNHVVDPTDSNFDFTFRNGATPANNPLTTLIFAVGSSEQTGTWIIDDIYLDSTGQNLANPTFVPETSAAGLLGLAGLALLRRRRVK